MKPQKPHISVAPMMDWTDRHCRYFHRLLSPHAVLYTEMVTCGALLHGDADRFLRFHRAEHPVVLQLGGSSPQDLAQCAKLAQNYGYDAVNLNCGCPSDRVQKGRFGACLMKEPELVADCVKAMQDSVSIPVSVKCRIGVDDHDSYEFLETFIATIANTGCTHFDIHARKAWLQGLSPKENREKPPLEYARVAKIKQTFPDLTIIVNGGIQTLDHAQTHLQTFDGIMIGREAYQNPYFLAELENALYKTNTLSRDLVVQAMIRYIREQHEKYDTPVKSITRHMTGLYQGLPGAKHWRRFLSTQMQAPDTIADKLLEALEVQLLNASGS